MLGPAAKINPAMAPPGRQTGIPPPGPESVSPQSPTAAPPGRRGSLAP